MHAWLHRIDQHFPVRYTAWLLAAVGFLLAAFTWAAYGMGGGWALLFLFVVVLGLRDTRQPRHSVLRNYPVIGHLRFLLEFVRPELRQYFIESDREAAPFSRQQRSLVYQRAKGDPDKRPFGTQLDVHAAGFEWINHSVAPTTLASHDFRVEVGGGGTSCTQPYSASVFNISAMSFGSLSANAIMALNAGAKKGGFAHDTGEGSISTHHRVHGGDLVWEIGSGYFGCRHPDGSFSEERFVENALAPQVKMIEVKLSQGAKPGHGGVLPGPKVTAEIAAARGVPQGVDCISPARHAAFSTPVEMMQFIERLRRLSGGKPTGFKLCIGHPWEWFAIAKAMLETGLVPDFIVVDG
ncbi:MAG: FMN-binding glutamate synthase family protein, partial [Rubrivivax sp.]|nr:FMN-binding glutamate synthase family protein [Rubrivivax sp.]